MQNKTMKISLTLENREFVTLESKRIVAFLGGFRKNYYSHGVVQGCNYCELIIPKDAKLVDSSEFITTENWLDRLVDSPDITNIEIGDESYYVPWDGEWYNSLQIAQVRDLDVRIIIAQK